MNKLPLLSICTSVYNAGKKLIRFLESISSQTYSNLEVIIVDDCSSDEETLKILESLETGEFRFDKPFKILRNSKNLGLMESFQEALDSAKGEYFAFPESDDSLDSNFYEVLMDKIVRTNSDVCKGLYFGILEPRDDNNSLKEESNKLQKILDSQSDFVIDYVDLETKDVIYRNITDITYCWFYVFNRNILSFRRDFPSFINAFIYGVNNLLYHEFKRCEISPAISSYYYYYYPNSNPKVKSSEIDLYLKAFLYDKKLYESIVDMYEFNINRIKEIKDVK